MAKPKNTASPTLEHWPLGQFKRYGRNSRTHSDAQVEQIAASLLEFGWGPPILVRGETGEIAAGHGRLSGAELLVQRGHQEFATAPVLIRHGWTDDQFRAYVIADNKLAENAGWDKEMLALELGELKAAGFDIESTGFSAEELDQMFSVGNAGKTDPDAAPPAPDTPVTRLGDVWILGQHRIICGDSTDAATVERVLAGSKPHLMVTDPPYGVDYDPSWRVNAGMGGAGTATGVVLNDDRADWSEAWALFPGTVAYVWHGGLHAGTVMNSLTEGGFKLRAQIIWVKSRFALSRGDYHWHHEPAWYAVKDGEDDHWTDEARYVEEHGLLTYAVQEGETGHWNGDRKQSTLWEIAHIKSETGHGTQKPIECMKRPIENNSFPGEAVYEPFSGSGTTIIACEMTGRRCRALELSPTYVDVAVRRWEEFTGEAAVLEEDGRTFADVADDRLALDPEPKKRK